MEREEVSQKLKNILGEERYLRWNKRFRRRFLGWTSSLRNQPLSRDFGVSRGTPIDRYYIEKFLEENKESIRGEVLEIADATYTKLFGGKRVTGSHVLHATEGNPEATIVGDLSTGENIPKEAFDCVILTQTLQFIFDTQSAVRHCFEALKPGGTLLVTVPGISQICRYDAERWGDYWRFTSQSLEKLFSQAFPSDSRTIRTYGNLNAAVSLLKGKAVEETSREDLALKDPDYELILALRATRPSKCHTNN